MKPITSPKDLRLLRPRVTISFTDDQWEAIKDMTGYSSRPLTLMLSDIILVYFKQIQESGGHCPIYPFAEKYPDCKNV